MYAICAYIGGVWGQCRQKIPYMECLGLWDIRPLSLYVECHCHCAPDPPKTSGLSKASLAGLRTKET